MSRTHLAIRHSYLNLKSVVSPNLERFMLHVFLNAHAMAW
jgi:hypothetical protein